MNIFQALFLGIVQGITEFLPISSSGHLIAVPWLFSWPRHSLSFDVSVHAGTGLALIIYFRQYWKKLLREGFLSLRERALKNIPERRIFWLITLATLPAAVIGKLFETRAETVLRSPLLIAFTMAGFAVIFYIIDRRSRKTKTLPEINIFDAVVIGLFQALAIIPGVSRSGITIVSGLALRLNRESAARFSFLLCTPIILGATVLKINDIWGMVKSSECLYLLSGFFSSAIAGLFAIRYLLNFVKKHNFNLFILYRLIFGLTILSVFFSRR